MSDLKLYQSHKQVHARPMTRGEFIETKKRTLDGGSPDDPGYFVIYSKDTKDHYESWSPKHVFDEGYSLPSFCSQERPCVNCFADSGDCLDR